MNKAILIDTDILIDYLKGEKQSVVFLEKIKGPLLISSINAAELYSGVKKGKEESILELFLKAFQIIPVSIEIAKSGGLYYRDFKKSHNIGLADAVIAATVDIMECDLATLNKKHYPMFNNVLVPYNKK